MAAPVNRNKKTIFQQDGSLFANNVGEQRFRFRCYDVRSCRLQLLLSSHLIQHIKHVSIDLSRSGSTFIPVQGRLILILIFGVAKNGWAINKNKHRD